METETRRIPPWEWRTFFEGFTRRHAGWLSTVRVLTSGFGAQTQVRELRLEGIEADPDAIFIHLGERPERHIAHRVEEPVGAWVEVEEDGTELALEIESATGAKTILEFRSAIKPEMVDGLIAPSQG